MSSRSTLDPLRFFFQTGKSRTIHFRRDSLLGLEQGLHNHEKQILAALKQDLGKGAIEAYASEIGFVQAEIRFALKHLDTWTNPIKQPTPLLHFPAKSIIRPEPKGVVLIIGPWNYPLGLLLSPLVGAIAAGNCSVLKPSEFAPHTAAAIKNLIEDIYPEGFCQVHLGDDKTATELLRHDWDHVFFTGSTRVGRLVMAAAAKTLSPVTLELGGKSPCLVLEDTNIDITAERIVWGKFINAGQTCVAPDHVYVPTSIFADLTAALIKAIERFYGPDIKQSPDYGRIINQAHFKRLCHYLTEGDLIYGGASDENTLYLPPTLLANIKPDSVVLQEEIFGPILPILPYYNLDSLLNTLQKKPKPLALYIFTRNIHLQNTILSQLSSGTVAINDTMNQIATPYLPLGGIGHSGMGQYHGKASFDCFTHYRGILSKNPYVPARLSFPPYKISLKLFKIFYKWLLG